MDSSWPEYPAGTALLSDGLLAVPGDASQRCRLWTNSGLLSYAWIN